MTMTDDQYADLATKIASSVMARTNDVSDAISVMFQAAGGLAASVYDGETAARVLEIAAGVMAEEIRKHFLPKGTMQ